MKLIGIVLPVNTTSPPPSYISAGIVQFKSDRFHTSMYPPTMSTLNDTPVLLILSTEKGPVTKVSEVGFL